MISGIPKVVKENDGSVSKTGSANWSDISSKLNDASNQNPILPNEAQFFSGFPWVWPTANNGMVLHSFGNTNQYCDPESVIEFSNKIRLEINEKPILWPEHKPLIAPGQLGTTKVQTPIELKYGVGVITHAKKFRKGRFKVRAKLAQGLHLWQSIWLSQANSPYKEIDIIEAMTGSVPPLYNFSGCTVPDYYCHKGQVNLWLNQTTQYNPVDSDHVKFAREPDRIIESLISYKSSIKSVLT
jgi:hypothetical protein